MNIDNGKSWNPYVAGSLTGLVIIFAAWIAGQYFGASSSFPRVAGLVYGIFSLERVQEMDYFGIFVPRIDWQMMFVSGVLIGSFFSAVTSGSFKIKPVPDMWTSRFGSSWIKRGIIAFIGGLIMMFGARLAGGCPSGHGFSSFVQLGVSGIVSVICFFIGGIILANILYRGGIRK
jgi:uncharacterized membrane protein YedE/YeeE